MHWGFVWGGRRHITFCLLSRAGGVGVGGGGVWGRHTREGGGQKANFERATALQSHNAQRPTKRLLHVESCQM